MKKQAILIQCHNKPEIVNSMIDYFPEEYFDFYIHVDKKSNIIKDIRRKKNIYLVKKRIDVQWGRFSQVEATLSIIKLITNPEEYSYCHLISGNDYPVKSVEWFLSKFSEKNQAEYIDSYLIDGTGSWTWGGLDRYQCYYPQWMIQRPTYKLHRVIRVCYREFIMRTKIFKRKKYPVQQFYGGSSWWSLTGSMVSWIKENLDKRYADFFRNEVCSDEVFFSTLVRYSPYKFNIANKNLRYMIWDEKENATGGPVTINKERYNIALKSDNAFCRKLVDLDVLNF